MKLTLIKLTNAERDEALEYSNTVLDRVYGSNYTDLTETGRYFVGRCGEIAVRKWADENDLMYEETVNDAGISDKQDFLFHFIDGRMCRTNVKTSLHPNASYLMQPAAQAARHGQDLYIGATGDDNKDNVVLRLWGAITQSEFTDGGELVDRKIKTLQFPLSELPYSMELLASKIMKRQQHQM